MVMRVDTVIDKKIEVHNMYLVIENMSYGQLKGGLLCTYSTVLCYVWEMRNY